MEVILGVCVVVYCVVLPVSYCALLWVSKNELTFVEMLAMVMVAPLLVAGTIIFAPFVTISMLYSAADRIVKARLRREGLRVCKDESSNAVP